MKKLSKLGLILFIMLNPLSLVASEKDSEVVFAVESELIEAGDVFEVKISDFSEDDKIQVAIPSDVEFLDKGIDSISHEASMIIIENMTSATLSFIALNSGVYRFDYKVIHPTEDHQFVSDDINIVEERDFDDDPQSEVLPEPVNKRATQHFDPFEWTFVMDGNQLILQEYRGTDVDVYIPGEVFFNGIYYHVGLHEYPLLRIRTDLESVVMEAVNGKKVFSKGDSLNQLFTGMVNLKYLNLEGLDVSNVKTMNSIFSDAKSLETLKIASWDTSSLTSMILGFSETKSLKHIDIGEWDVSQLINLNHLFMNSGVETVDLSKWAPDPKFMDSIFYGTKNLRNVDLGNFKTTRIVSARSMFWKSGIETVDLENWDFGQSQSLMYMFSEMENLTSVNVKGWKFSEATELMYLFAYTPKLKTVDISSWDTSQVDNIAGIFRGSGIEVLDLSTWDVENVVYNIYAFAEMPNLKEINFGDASFSSISSLQSVFMDSENLTKIKIKQSNFPNLTIIDDAFHTQNPTDLTLFTDHPLFINYDYEQANRRPGNLGINKDANGGRFNNGLTKENILNPQNTFIASQLTLTKDEVEAFLKEEPVHPTKEFDSWNLDYRTLNYPIDLYRDDAVNFIAQYKTFMHTVTIQDESRNYTYRVKNGEFLDTSILPNFEKDGYRFDGFHIKNTEPKEFFNPKEDPVQKDLELITVYTPYTFTVILKDDSKNNSDETQVLTYRGENTRIKTSGFNRIGFKLIGWKDESGDYFALNHDFKTSFIHESKTKVLTAVWEAYTMDVSFVDLSSNNKTITQTLSYDNNDTKLQGVNFSRLGYHFKGWQDDQNNTYQGTEDLGTLFESEDGSLVLYAQWEPYTYTVQFHANDGKGTMKSVRKVYGMPLLLPPNIMNRDDHEFVGWATQADGSVQFQDEEELIEDLSHNDQDIVTLYAIWSYGIDRYFVQAQDTEIAIGELANAVKHDQLQETMITKTKAVAYIEKKDGQKENLPIYVGGLQKFESIQNPETLNLDNLQDSQSNQSLIHHQEENNTLQGIQALSGDATSISDIMTSLQRRSLFYFILSMSMVSLLVVGVLRYHVKKQK